MQSHSDREFTKLAGDYLDDRSARHPDAATELGDHRFDAQLPTLRRTRAPPNAGRWIGGRTRPARWTLPGWPPNTRSTRR